MAIDFLKTQDNLQALAERAQLELKTRQDALTERAQRVRVELDHRQQEARGKLRDEPRYFAYSLLSHTLGRASSALSSAPRLAPLTTRSAARLQRCAHHWESQSQQLLAPPIPDYDALNVHQVNAALAELDFYQLQKVRAYEVAHKNRVTVLREIERLTAA